MLSSWLGQTPFEDPFRHYYLAVNQQGNILAGMVIVEQYKLMSMQIEQMPMIARLLNKFLAVVPQSGILKQLTINQIWYAPNQLAVAQYLWEAVRWEWRNKGNNMVCFFDPRSPIKEVVQQPFWMPNIEVYVCYSWYTHDG